MSVTATLTSGTSTLYQVFWVDASITVRGLHLICTPSRLIPAYRELTSLIESLSFASRAHPRVQGAYNVYTYSIAGLRGSSPRTGSLLAVDGEVVSVRLAHPRVQGAYCPRLLPSRRIRGSSPRTGSLHFLTRRYTSRQPENIQFPCVEMSR